MVEGACVGGGVHGARCKRQGMMMDRVVKLLLAPANHPEHRNEDEAIQQRQRVVLHLANPMQAAVVWTGECKGTVAVGLHRGVRPGNIGRIRTGTVRRAATCSQTSDGPCYFEFRVCFCLFCALLVFVLVAICLCF